MGNAKRITNGSRTLTIDEAQQAIIHAEAFIRLALAIDQKNFGIAAYDWLEKYGSEPVTVPEESGYDNKVDFEKLEIEAGLR